MIPIVRQGVVFLASWNSFLLLTKVQAQAVVVARIVPTTLQALYKLYLYLRRIHRDITVSGLNARMQEKVTPSGGDFLYNATVKDRTRLSSGVQNVMMIAELFETTEMTEEEIIATEIPVQECETIGKKVQKVVAVPGGGTTEIKIPAV